MFEPIFGTIIASTIDTNIADISDMKKKSKEKREKQRKIKEEKSLSLLESPKGNRELSSNSAFNPSPSTQAMSHFELDPLFSNAPPIQSAPVPHIQMNSEAFSNMLVNQHDQMKSMTDAHSSQILRITESNNTALTEITSSFATATEKMTTALENQTKSNTELVKQTQEFMLKLLEATKPKPSRKYEV